MAAGQLRGEWAENDRHLHGGARLGGPVREPQDRPRRFLCEQDSLYPSRAQGAERRVNWGWATVPPASTQSLPREITFNAVARTLEQAPIDELTELRQSPAFTATDIELTAGTPVQTKLAPGITKASELVAIFVLPTAPTTLGVAMGLSALGDKTIVHKRMASTNLVGNDYNVTHYPTITNSTQASAVCAAACQADAQCKAWTYVVRGEPANTGDCCLKSAVPCPSKSGSCISGAKVETSLDCKSQAFIECTVEFSAAAVAALHAPACADGQVRANVELPVQCGNVKDTLTLTALDTALELRVFTDATFVEAYFQNGRVAITKSVVAADKADYFFSSTGAGATLTKATVYPLKSIWVSADEVRAQKRIYSTEPAPVTLTV